MSLEIRLVEFAEALGRDYAAVLLQTRDEHDTMMSAAQGADFITSYYDGKAEEPAQ